jgi:starch synthase
MLKPSAQPRILFITPEVKFIPNFPASPSQYGVASDATFTDDLAGLIVDFQDLGVDVHVVQPDYRRIFTDIRRKKACRSPQKMPAERVHLARDRVFFYCNCPDSNDQWENTRISLAFQREIINHVIPLVQPDLIHCHDWMTGLIPAMAKRIDLPCLFTVQNPGSVRIPLIDIEDMGIDCAAFWQSLYFERFPFNYEETRQTNPADFLLSGVFAAGLVDIAGTLLLTEIGKGQLAYRRLLSSMLNAKLASGRAVVQTNHRAAAQRYIEFYEKMLQRSPTGCRRDRTADRFDSLQIRKKMSSIKSYRKINAGPDGYGPPVPA